MAASRTTTTSGQRAPEDDFVSSPVATCTTGYVVLADVAATTADTGFVVVDASTDCDGEAEVFVGVTDGETEELGQSASAKNAPRRMSLTCTST